METLTLTSRILGGVSSICPKALVTRPQNTGDPQSTETTSLSQIAELDSESHGVQTEYNAILKRTSAIAKLLNKPITCIFETMHDGEHATRPELFASQVTRHWQDIVINTPKLWSRISVVNPSGNDEDTFGALYINKSKDLPLDLTIRDCRAAVFNDESVFYPIIRRCRLVKIAVHNACGDGDFFDSLEYAHAPLLQFFDLTSNHETFYGQLGSHHRI